MIKSKKITAFCMAVMLIFGSLPLFASGAAEGATDIEKSLDALINYSDGADSYKEVAVADLLRLSSGVSVTAAEKDFTFS